MNKIFTLILFAAAICLIPLKNEAQVNVKDSLAVVDLYNNTNGSKWINNTSWLSAQPVSNWFGITVLNGRVNKIELQNNNLNGAIPQSIRDISDLTWLDLSLNSIGGSIPESIGHLSNLTTLILYNNKLTGNIPSSIINFSNLHSLVLYNNQLTGSIPSAIINLTQLSDLMLGDNQLSGTIPSQLGNLSNLFNLDLSHNQLTGNIPESIGNLSKLHSLYLQDNKLQGNIPGSIGNLSALDILWMGGNQLSGNMPASLGDLSNLTDLNLAGNQLSGSIPSSIGNLVKLGGLSLTNNLLSGDIPASMGQLIKLTQLNLDINKLSGSIPSSFGNLSKLSMLLLEGNELGGNIPNTLFTFKSLGVFWLFLNRFTFEGTEKLVDTYGNAIIAYDPQASIPIHEHEKTLSVSAGGTLANNTYKWYKNAELIKTAIGDSTFTPLTEGNYSVTVTNSIATQLSLSSDTIKIGSTLPVSLINLKAKASKNSASLSWQTTTEINAKQFIIQRSVNGRTFSNIGTQAANDNSSIVHDYSFVDNKPVSGINYYRLIIEDLDGKIDYSPVVSVVFELPNNMLLVYPNPSPNNVVVKFDTQLAEKYNITISDISGKTISQFDGLSDIGSNKVNINLQNLAAGLYIITLTNAANNKKSMKLYKR